MKIRRQINKGELIKVKAFTQPRKWQNKIGESICKQGDWRELNFQNLQTAYEAQMCIHTHTHTYIYKQHNKKMSRRPK